MSYGKFVRQVISFQLFFFFFQAEDGIRDWSVTGVQTCALPIFLSRKITAMRVRCHGDYHLGQLLYTGKDFFIIDFEGEPARPLSERRLKRTALKDVAGMLRSFHYAAYAALFDVQTKGTLSTDGGSAEPWADFWYYWVSVVFLKAYVEAASRGGFLPAAREELQVLLDAFLLDKAVYELGYEINNRPTWVKIPLRGILSLVGEENR